MSKPKRRTIKEVIAQLDAASKLCHERGLELVETRALAAENNDRAARYCGEIGDERKRRQVAEALRDETLKEFANLKERLHNAEVETARLRGFIERVHELDHPLIMERPDGGDPHVKINFQPPDDGLYGESPYGRQMGAARRRHWTNFGQR